MTALLQGIKDGAGKSLSTASTEAHNMYDDMVCGIRQKMRDELVDGWTNINTHSQVEFVRLEGSVGDALLQLTSNVRNLLRKSSDLFSTQVTKTLDVGSSKRPSADAVR